MKHPIILPVIALTLASTNLIANQYDTHQNSSTYPSMSKEHEKNDAIEIILQDHARIRTMMSELKTQLNSNIAESRKQFKVLQDFLVKHETMEQKAFYPELEKDAALKKIISELKTEEDNASKALKEIDGIKDDREWVTKVEKLMQAVEYHAESEETKLFPEVRKTLDASRLSEIATKLKDYRTKHNMNK